MFQNDEPMVHKLYKEGKDLFLKLVGKVYVTSSVNQINFIDEEKLKSPSSEPQIAGLEKDLTFDIEICRLLDEWKILKFEEGLKESSPEVRIDQYWAPIFCLRNACYGLK